MALPPRASLQGIPQELRDQIYHLIAIDTSTRVVSAKNPVTAYKDSHPDHYRILEKTTSTTRDLKGKRVSREDTVHLPIGTRPALKLLGSATALHPLSQPSRQFRQEYRPYHVQPNVIKHRFILQNFDLKQLKLINHVAFALRLNAYGTQVFRTSESRSLLRGG